MPKHPFKTICTSLICFAIIITILFSAGYPAYADEEHNRIGKATIKDIGETNYTPISSSYVIDGTYDVACVSSSKYFKIEKAQLTAKEGKLTATLTMSSSSYLLLFEGTSEQATTARASKYIEPEKDLEGNCIFTIPVPALNASFDCAAFSKKKEKWYDRKLMVLASSLPAEALTINAAEYEKNPVEKKQEESQFSEKKAGEADDSTVEINGIVYGSAEGATAMTAIEPMDLGIPDGEYSIGVNLAGGSGRATVSSPTLLIVKDGKSYARLLWSSSYYDYMIVGGKTYLNETTDGGNSSFTIPVPSTDTIIPIIADTTAMGDPVAIEYSLVFYEETIGDKGLIPQEATKKVLVFAIIIIVVGGILNFAIKRKFAV